VQQTGHDGFIIASFVTAYNFDCTLTPTLSLKGEGAGASEILKHVTFGADYGTKVIYENDHHGL
jgi:hypothetical protein